MKAPVVDCSVSAAWILADEQSDLADHALDHVAEEGGTVPALWWAEVHNVLLIAERRGRVTPEDSDVALSALAALRMKLDDAPRGDMVLRLARRHGLTAYDAIYLELASRERRALATLDKRLRRAAKAAGVEVMKLPDEEDSSSEAAETPTYLGMTNRH